MNELFASAAMRTITEVGGALSETQRAALASAADLVSHNRLLDRFQLALILLARSPLDTGVQPYQDAQLLVHLRDELVHFKPRFRGGAGAPTSERWLIALESKLTSVSPFTGVGNPFFPDKCLGRGCTVWGWNAAVNFCDEFFQRIGVTPIYNQIRSQLNP